jgi:hypothetical protein
MDVLSLYFGGVTCGVCFVAPWIAIFFGVLVVRRLITAEKKKAKKEARGQSFGHRF